MTGFRDDDFEPHGDFGSRGITDPAVAGGAFFRYDIGDPDDVIPGVAVVGGVLSDAACRVLRQRADRASGMMMRRFPVPEADPLLYAEMRPNWAIWSGASKNARQHRHAHLQSCRPETRCDPDTPRCSRCRHVARARTEPRDVFLGMTSDEYRGVVKRAGQDVGAEHYGDHYGDDTDDPHTHVRVAKYLFKKNATDEVPDPDGPHAHTDYKSVHGARRHVERAHLELAPEMVGHRVRRDRWGNVMYEVVETYTPLADPDAPFGWPTIDWLGNPDRTGIPPDDVEHHHMIEVDVTRYAQRLSSHPMGFARIADADRVFFMLESCLKEAAVVTAGEATFSCPSVSLWETPELEAFAVNHLRGKRVYVVCDSDWGRPNDDSVIRQTLLARDALRLFLDDPAGVYVNAAAPPPGGPHCEHTDRKHGADDALGPCGRRDDIQGVDDFLVIEREAKMGLAEWLADHRPNRRGRWIEGVKRDAIVLRWIATHAGEDGTFRMSLRSAAGNLQAELGRDTYEAARVAVDRAVVELRKAGAITEDPNDPISDRTRYHLRAEKEDWVGTLIVTPELRADTHTPTIRESENRSI